MIARLSGKTSKSIMVSLVWMRSDNLSPSILGTTGTSPVFINILSAFISKFPSADLTSTVLALTKDAVPSITFTLGTPATLS